MEIKKNPKVSLENFSKVFFLIGLVFTLFTVDLLIEYKTYEKVYNVLDEFVMTEEITEDIPIIKLQKIEPTQTSAPPPPSIEKIEIVQDDIVIPETILESTETNENEMVTNAEVTTDDIIEVKEGEIIVEDIPFVLIENPPVYPGCKGNKEQLKKCFNAEVMAFFGERFNVDLATELGLSAGKKRLFVVFTINNKGNVSDIKARGPHPTLEKEVARVLSLLPKLTPGKQRGIPVGVSYSIPVTFEVIK
ncbi:energy transducer TonB [Polaribacter sp. Hel_I_88]|uniref:energy transducer TonB n=1 Tax=Polaribacter sp. Hel_I_88 TaxID=1250006 RepID=UPI000478CA47|nr:energy transducer TonB [Polaribacter sp. Hel_I_88]